MATPGALPELKASTRADHSIKKHKVKNQTVHRTASLDMNNSQQESQGGVPWSLPSWTLTSKNHKRHLLLGLLRLQRPPMKSEIMASPKECPPAFPGRKLQRLVGASLGDPRMAGWPSLEPSHTQVVDTRRPLLKESQGEESLWPSGCKPRHEQLATARIAR